MSSVLFVALIAYNDLKSKFTRELLELPVNVATITIKNIYKFLLYFLDCKDFLINKEAFVL